MFVSSDVLGSSKRGQNFKMSSAALIHTCPRVPISHTVSDGNIITINYLWSTILSKVELSL